MLCCSSNRHYLLWLRKYKVGSLFERLKSSAKITRIGWVGGGQKSAILTHLRHPYEILRRLDEMSKRLHDIIRRLDDILRLCSIKIIDTHHVTAHVETLQTYKSKQHLSSKRTIQTYLHSVCLVYRFWTPKSHNKLQAKLRIIRRAYLESLNSFRIKMRINNGNPTSIWLES